MRRKAGFFLLAVLILLQFSCKTAGDIVPEEAVSEEAVAEGGDTPENREGTPDSASVVDDQQNQADPEEVEETVPDTPLKEPGRMGGIKEDPVPQLEISAEKAESMPEAAVELPDPEDATVEKDEEVPFEEAATDKSPDEVLPAFEPRKEEPSTAETEPSEPAVSESVVVTDPAPVVIIEEPAAPAELPQAESEGEGLPSESEGSQTNPLLPVVIQGDAHDEQNGPADSSIDTDTVSSDGESSRLASAPAEPAESRPIDQDDLTLSRDPSGKLVVSLAGSGWVFLSGGEDSAYTLFEKYYDPEKGETRFTFRVDDTGSFDTRLQFVKQDIVRGESEDRTLDLNRDLYQSLSENPVGDSEASGSEEISESSGQGIPAGGTDDPFSDILTQDSLPSLTEDNNAESRLSESTDTELQPVELEYTEDELSAMSASELYELARLYESPGPAQSLEKARDLYIRIRAAYPVTEERFMAEDRIRYLDRYYFKVQ